MIKEILNRGVQLAVIVAGMLIADTIYEKLSVRGK